MRTCFLLLVFLSKLYSSYIIEIEVAGRKKQCVSEIFKKNEPISMRGTMVAADSAEFSVYLTIETMSHKLLTHKKFDNASPSTVLAFNNDEDQQLNLCIDNFEAYMIIVEMEIKFGVHLGDTDLTPTKSVSFSSLLYISLIKISGSFQINGFPCIKKILGSG